MRVEVFVGVVFVGVRVPTGHMIAVFIDPSHYARAFDSLLGFLWLDVIISGVILQVQGEDVPIIALEGHHIVQDIWYEGQRQS